MKKCPKCGCEEFFVSAHVVQDWLVDGDGYYLQTENECVEVTHRPNIDDLWMCADCSHVAEGREFEIKEEM